MVSHRSVVSKFSCSLGLRFFNPKTDSSFLYENPKTDYWSKWSTTDVDSLDHVHNRILWVHDPKCFFTTDTSGVSWKIVKQYIVLFVQISLDAWKKSSQTYGFMVGTSFFTNAKDEFLRKGQWSFRTCGESSWKDFETSTEPGLNVWMKFFGIARRRTHFSSLYPDFLVLLRIGAVPHLWSRQTCSFSINLKLRVRFFPKSHIRSKIRIIGILR